MISLKQFIISEGGHVFDGGSDPIKKEYITSTIKKFVDEIYRIFPKAKPFFDNPQTLGSVGKKDISGDIDLAIDEKHLKNLDAWDIDTGKVDELVEKFRKRARTSTPEQILKRAIIEVIGEKINDKSDLIKVNIKESGNGVMFSQFPQFDGDKQLDLTVQIDTNFGNIDWLKFAYFSDSYTGNVKGLHRTQLMLHMFVYKGYIFNHNTGVVKKENHEKVADNPKEAIEVLNKAYHFNLTEKILQNYNKLQEYLRDNLDTKDLDNIYDIYLKTLDSTRCDIPEDLQEYWIRNQKRLGLKGKFLPEDSRLCPYKEN